MGAIIVRLLVLILNNKSINVSKSKAQLKQLTTFHGWLDPTIIYRDPVYADDLKIVKYIRTLSDCESLHDSLNNFIHYCDANQLKVNVNKCHFMR
jgi:hypothetical protein